MPDLTQAQVAAADEVKSITNSSSHLALLTASKWNGCAVLDMEISTSAFSLGTGGLEVQPLERVTVLVAQNYPAAPPQASVKHLRWAGFPHVLQGTRLCIYLDPGTEWDPTRGMSGFLRRLLEWFEDAIGGRFDPTTALYHPVGGVLHRTSGTPTVVVDAPMPVEVLEGGIVHRIGLRKRSDHRIDIAAWQAPFAPDLAPGLLVLLPEYLPLGGGSRLSDLLTTVRQQLDRNRLRRVETLLRRQIQCLASDEHLHVMIAVPNPARDIAARRHLIGWRLRSSDSAQALSMARSEASMASESEEPEVEWTYVDDQRGEIAVRRDSERPVAVYVGAAVEVWGCGALGSWIAELLVRAGILKVTLRDPGYVTQGLLVRQNYTEEDVGRPKAAALAERLARLSDTCEIEGIKGNAKFGLRSDVESCDFIFDTTVNTAVNAALDDAQKQGTLHVPVVQIATDNQTATLGIVTVTSGSASTTTSELDQGLHERTAGNAALIPFLTFWDHDAHPPLTTAPGCSVPTFHGSAADAMGIAASAVSVAATALSRQIAGAYLLSLPHSPFDVPPLTPVESATNVSVDVALPNGLAAGGATVPGSCSWTRNRRTPAGSAPLRR